MAMFYPLDLLRTRVHTRTGAKGAAALRGVRQIFAEEGIRGLYRGVGVAVAAHSVGWGLYLTTFRSCQNGFRVTAGGGEDSSTGDFCAAVVAACFTSTLVTPLSVLKTRTQLHDEKGTRPSRGLVGGLRAIARSEGWRSLFRGVGPQILLSMHTTIQVALYEVLKRHLWAREDPPTFGVAAVSAFSKCVAAVATNPLEVCRTRLQDRRNLAADSGYSGLRAAMRTIYSTEGVRGLYRGVGINCLRVAPTTAVAFVLYEKTLLAMRWASPPAAARNEQ